MIQIQETQEQNSGERLGLNPSATRPYPTKIFCCKFCRRIFYSSQALGGHQNAHKRERGLVRYFQASMSRSLGVQPHAHLHNPPRDGDVTPSTYVTATPQQDVPWPGSYRIVDRQQTEHKSWSSSSEMIDLNLKL